MPPGRICFPSGKTGRYHGDVLFRCQRFYLFAVVRTVGDDRLRFFGRLCIFDRFLDEGIIAADVLIILVIRDDGTFFGYGLRDICHIAPMFIAGFFSNVASGSEGFCRIVESIPSPFCFAVRRPFRHPSSVLRSHGGAADRLPFHCIRPYISG